MSQRAISSAECNLQQFLYMTLDGEEFFLSGLMSYDNYLAICNSLHYPVLTSCRVSLLIMMATWLGRFAEVFLFTPVTMLFPFFASWEINHFFCEVPTLLKFSCRDTSAQVNQTTICLITTERGWDETSSSVMKPGGKTAVFPLELMHPLASGKSLHPRPKVNQESMN